jgi:hypothetical protein
MPALLDRHWPLLALLLAAAAGSLLIGLGGSGTDQRVARQGDEARAAGTASLIDWRLFGRIPERTHYLAAPERLNPPLKRLWSFNDRR